MRLVLLVSFLLEEGAVANKMFCIVSGGQVMFVLSIFPLMVMTCLLILDPRFSLILGCEKADYLID